MTMERGTPLSAENLFYAGAIVDRPSDEDVANVERGVMRFSEREILWGGDRGPGLVFTVATLAKSVESLGAIVTKLAERVQGEDGITSQLKELKKAFADAEERRATLEAQRIARNTFLGRIAIAVAAPNIGAVAWLLYRSIVIMQQGHL
jgi:hypothetical protein